MPLSLDLPKGVRGLSSSKVVSVEAGGADAADIARHWLHACSTSNTDNLSKGRCDSSDGASLSGCLLLLGAQNDSTQSSHSRRLQKVMDWIQKSPYSRSSPELLERCQVLVNFPNYNSRSSCRRPAASQSDEYSYYFSGGNIHKTVRPSSISWMNMVVLPAIRQ